MGLPALSPTMTAGVVSEWTKAVGDAFKAGDVIAKVETDKATVDFESQEEGFLAQILVPAGTSVTVGSPIAVTVRRALLCGAD